MDHAASSLASRPLDIPTPSRAPTPTPALPPLDHSSPTSYSPESPELATPQTPSMMRVLGTTSVAAQKRPAVYASGGYESQPGSWEPQLASSSSPRDSYFAHRRRSSTPFMFLGEPDDIEAGPAPSEPAADPATSFPSQPSSDQAMEPAQNAPVQGHQRQSSASSLGAAVRRHIRRSKTSFKKLIGDEDEPAATPETSTISPDMPDTDDSPPVSRLKALMRPKRLRAQSVSSSLSMSPALTPASGSSTPGSSGALSTLGCDDDSGIMPGRPKARRGTLGMLDSTRERIARRRSVPLMAPQLQAVRPPFVVVAGVQSPSAPLPSDELVWGTLSYRGTAPEPEEVKVDYFTTLLPRELKLAVLKSLLAGWVELGGLGRWDGINGGRKELIRISRVSREWQSLCFDGELWRDIDFGAFAKVLRPATMQAILKYARPCVKSLCLNGLDAVPGKSIVGRAMVPNTGFGSYTSLTTLDLRGCHTIQEADIVDMLSLSPNLKRLNLKGSRVITSVTLEALRQRVLALEELDVSRAWELTFLDIERFVVKLTPRQRNSLVSLRVAGLPNASSGRLLQRIPTHLPKLARLDLNGCSWLSLTDMREYVTALGRSPSSLTHLILTACSNLVPEAFELLVGRLPNMEIFEAAGLELVFYLDPPPTLARLVRSMPRLRKLDLDGTGRFGGVDDRLLHELVPGACAGSVLEESQLESLKIGNAKFVSAGAVLRVVQSLPKLTELVADGTNADNAVMRAFLASHPTNARLSLVDCSHITPEAYTKLSARTRPRTGFEGYLSAPFGYTPLEAGDALVLRTFSAWRRVGVPGRWREAREEGEKALEARHRAETSSLGPVVGRRASWWRTAEEVDMDRGACVVM